MTKKYMAVNGCLHGKFEQLLSVLEPSQTELLLLLGDLQLLSKKQDLSSCSIPYKYTYGGDVDKITDFKKIMTDDSNKLTQDLHQIGLVLGIGGNHENMGLLELLPFGGFILPNFYYMGFCNVIKYKGLKICGISGIVNGLNFLKEREFGFSQEKGLEQTQWWRLNKVSSYHVRFFDVLPLLLYEENDIDFVMTHDWPQNVFHNEDPHIESQLLKIKPFFRDDINSGKLGSTIYDKIMDTLRPEIWFSAHLHINYETSIEYENGDFTKFIALDKLVPRRLTDGVKQFEFPGEDSNEDVGNCGIELDENFIRIQKWCYINKETILKEISTLQSDPSKLDKVLTNIRLLYQQGKNSIVIEDMLKKPFYEEKVEEYTREYLSRNLGINEGPIYP
ncbi:uncharacterized protein HGUI_03075 [Hanseniaspora guilliermondii]|uniref:Calcineurin-like phosphoesterase domain-containing protein n=1 Tax=Hanseniaspora guilliermondii TaxID=56406 RepID=A0A1L0B720_9ASCO|nr:uncharacterized protein HGUI_03075 [Hanseniaspora guilliermondii]